MNTNTNDKTKRQLEDENKDLRERVEKMEKLVEDKKETGTYEGPDIHMYHDPFDLENNPHRIKKNPHGKVLGWKNPNLRDSPAMGWRGWTPVQYDDEIGKSLTEYITDPPAKMAGTAQQDNYVRRGTDSILCWLDEEIYLARQQKREQKALRHQMAASAHGNITVRPGVSTFGDGVQQESSSRGGRVDAPPNDTNPFSRTEMFQKE